MKAVVVVAVALVSVAGLPGWKAAGAADRPVRSVDKENVFRAGEAKGVELGRSLAWAVHERHIECRLAADHCQLEAMKAATRAIAREQGVSADFKEFTDGFAAGCSREARLACG